MTAALSTGRLALFMPSFRGGGAERVMVTLAEGFAGRGVAVDLLVAQREGPNEPAPAARIRVVDLRASRVLLAIPGLVRYLRRERPRAMLSALPHCNVVATWATGLAGGATRLVLSEHTTASLSAAHSPQRRARILPVFMRRAYRRAGAVVAVSDGAADDLASLTGIARADITRIYNPVVTPRLAARADETLDHPWFAASQPPVVLGVGRLTPAKDFATLVRAVAAVRARRQVRLLILGEGDERTALQSLASRVGLGSDFSLPGFVDNPYRYMTNAAVFALSSRWEGFGNALVEAMACGAAVVSTDCPNGPREILEGGRHGLLVPVGDPRRLAAALERQLDRPQRATVVERSRAFGVEPALERYGAVLGL